MASNNDKVIEKIAAILNKAENTDNEAERDTFMQAAQMMSSKYAIDLEVARRHTKGKQESVENQIVTVQVDTGRKGEKYAYRRQYADLMIAMAEANVLPWLVSNQGFYVKVIGPKFEVEQLEKLYAVLLTHMVADLTAYLNGDTWQEKIADRDTARASFVAGFCQHIKDRLIDARLDAERQANDEYGSEAALVISDKRQETWSAYQRPRGWGYTPGRGGNNRAGREAGRKSASNANLHNRDAVGARGRIGR